MNLRTVFRVLVTPLMFVVSSTICHGQGVTSSNPLEYAAIQKGKADINQRIKSQTSLMQQLAGKQGEMGAEATLMKKWERNYNSYLKKTQGYASSLRAATTLYAEGMRTLSALWEINAARQINPQGIFASLSMNNLYLETATEFIKTYRTIKQVVVKGEEGNMLNGAERTQLLWELNADLEQLNKKLRALALSITVYNFEDVWNRAIAGKIEKSNGMLAEEARKRMKRAATQVAKFYKFRQNNKPWK